MVTLKRRIKSNHDLNKDISEIKKALAQGAYDVKSKAGEYLSQYYDDVRGKSIEVQEDVSNYVSEKPIKSLSIAMLAGLAIGYFLNRS